MKQTFEKHRYWMKVPAMCFLGMLFFIAGLSKLLYASNSFSPFPFIETMPVVSAIYPALPYIEMAIGLLLIHGVLLKLIALISGSIVAVFIANCIYMISIGRGSELCGCFGMAGRLTYVDALVIDCLMAVMAVTIFFCHKGGYFNLTPWFLDSEPIKQNKGHNLNGLKVDMLSQK